MFQTSDFLLSETKTWKSIMQQIHRLQGLRNNNQQTRTKSLVRNRAYNSVMNTDRISRSSTVS